MLAEVATVISVIKGLNEAVSALKEAGGNASGFAAVMGRFAKANEAVQDVESKYVGRLSVQDSMQIQVAKRQLATFNQQLKDIMLMQGLAGDYKEIMDRVEESKIAHEKEIARKKRLRRERIEFAKTLGVILFGAFCAMVLIVSFIWWWRH